MKTKLFITGSSGFIGFHVAKKYLDKGFKVHGFDSMNNYYDVKLKKARYEKLEAKAKSFNSNFKMIKEDISKENEIMNIFESYDFNIVVNFYFYFMFPG